MEKCCDECAYDEMNPNSVNDMDWCAKHKKFVWPLEPECDEFTEDK